jgi:NAD(P)-dependent dehydrogenase (short-subunit alcohol dehydrogenase family)
MVNETIERMEDDDNGSRNGLRRHRRRLLTEPVITCMSDHVRGLALQYGSIAMLRVFIEVSPMREACIVAEIERATGSGQKLDEQERKKAIDSWVKTLCCRVGELYEQLGKFSSAIPWYKRCCSISASNQFENEEHSHDLSNLGVAQKRAGLLVEALASYDAAIALWNCDVALANRQTLVREMRHWTGTAVEHDFDDAREDLIREQLNARSLPYEQLPPGYYSDEQQAALPDDRKLAASGAGHKKLRLIWGRLGKAQCISPRTVRYSAGAFVVVMVAALVMCIVVRSVDVFLFNEWSISRAVCTATITTLVLDPCTLPSVRNHLDLAHLTEMQKVVAAAKVAVWTLHIVVPVCLHCLKEVACYFGLLHFLPMHQILVLGNVGAVLAFCGAMLRMAAQTPWRMPAGVHAVVGALTIFLLIKCEGDVLIETPTLACGSVSGADDAPGSCVVLLTGANKGIGYATAYSLATQGHTVLLACRSQDRCNEAASSIVAALGSPSEERVVPLGGLELSSLTRVEEWVAYHDSELPKIDVLFLNAGFLPQAGEQTEDGYEAGLGAMHFGHWSLVEGLFMRSMLAPVSPRVVVISSDAHRMGSFHSSLAQSNTGEGDLRGELTRGCPGVGQPVCMQLQYSDDTATGTSLSQEFPTKYIGGGSYCRAKLANVLYARHLPVVHEGWRAASVHPGMVYTEMAQRIARPYAWMQFGIHDAQLLFMRAMLRPASAAAAVVLRAAKSLEGNATGNGHYVNGMVRSAKNQIAPL